MIRSMRVSKTNSVKVHTKPPIFLLGNYFAALTCSLALTAVYLNVPLFRYLTSSVDPWKTFALIVAALALCAIWSNDRTKYNGIIVLVPLLLFAGINFLYKIFDPDPAVRAIAGSAFSATSIGIALGFTLAGVNERYLKIALLISILTLSVGITLDAILLQSIFLQIQPDRILGRFAFTHTNPNVAAEALLCANIMLIFLSPNSRSSQIALWLSALPVVLTFSRAGTIFYIATLLWFHIKIKRNSWSAVCISAISLIFVPLILSATLTFLIDNTSIENRNNITERMIFFTEFDVRDNSSNLRTEYAKIGLDNFLSSPIVGQNPGHSLLTTPDGLGYHNEFLYLGVEYGIVGLSIFFAMVTFLVWNRANSYHAYTARWFGIVFLLYGFFSHNLFDSAIWLTTYGYIAAAANSCKRNTVNNIIYKSGSTIQHR